MNEPLTSTARDDHMPVSSPDHLQMDREKGKKEAKAKSRIAIHPVHTYDSSALEVHAGACKLEANLRDID